MKHSRIIGIDILKILAIASVVLIHTTSMTLNVTHFDLRTYPWTFFYNQIVRFAVPLFFLISGFLLEYRYREEMDLFKFYRRRITRLVIPYLFWTGLYMLIPGQPYTEKVTASMIMYYVLYGIAEIQLYFIPAIFLVYLLYPILHLFKKLFTNGYIILLLGLAELYILYTNYYIKEYTYPTPEFVAGVNLFPFILGMAISHHLTRVSHFLAKFKYLIFLLTIVLGGWVLFESFTLYEKTLNYKILYNQYRPWVYLYAVSLFASLFYFLQNLSYNKFIHKLSSLSFFVFFIHIFMIRITWFIFEQLFGSNQILILKQFYFEPLIFSIVLVLSFGIGFLVNYFKKFDILVGIE